MDWKEGKIVDRIESSDIHYATFNDNSRLLIERGDSISEDEWSIYLEDTVLGDGFAVLYVGFLTLEKAKKYCEDLKNIHDNI